jgi:hypothetical protein
VRGAVKFFSSFFPLYPMGQGEGALFESFHLPSPFSTPRERVRVRGILLNSFLLSSLPLRERTKVRGAVKIFSSFLSPLHSAGEGQGKGSVKNQTKNQNEYPSALKYLISL